MNDDESFSQSDEEVAAQYGPGSPVRAASEWVALVLKDGSLAEAWPLTDAGLRRQLAEAWVEANRAHPLVAGEPSLVEALSVAEPEHPLWPDFARTQVEEFRGTWDWYDTARYGWGSRPRLVAPGEEIAVLVETAEGGEIMAQTEPRHGMGFRMRHDGQRWRVAGFEVEVPE